MKREKCEKGRIADKEQSIIKKNFIKNKEGYNFISHKVVKFKLTGAWVSKEQYFKILKAMKELGILNYSTRGVQFKKVKDDE